MVAVAALQCIEQVSAGHRIRLDKDLQGTHLKRWSLRSLLRADILAGLGGILKALLAAARPVVGWDPPGRASV